MDILDKSKEKYADSSFCEAQHLARYSKDDWLRDDIQKRNEEVYNRLTAFFVKQLQKA